MEDRSLVTWTRCESYEAELVAAALSVVLGPLGGLESLVRPGDRVLCKVNILMPATPAQAVTTHPEVLRAVLREVRRCGGIPFVGDNSASTPLRLTLQRAGLLAVCEQEGAELADLGPTVEIRATRSHAHRSFVVSEAMLGADVLVNLPKLKTHALCYMTLGVKNLYGFIPGLHKGRWHLAARSSREFSLLMADLFSAIREHARFGDRTLHLLDGVLGMEGEGPGPGGTPRHLGILMASRDAVALDRVACHAVGLDSSRLLTCEASAKLGLGEQELENIRILPELMPSPLVSDWKPPSGSGMVDPVGHSGLLGPLIQRLVLERPLVQLDRCTGCGQCQRVCAAEAIRVDKTLRKARIHLDSCIRCYCCAEVCPEAAIRKSETPPLGRLAGSRWVLPLAVLLVLGLVGLIVALGVLWFMRW